MINKIIILLAAVLAITAGVYSYQRSTGGNIDEQLKHATYLYEQRKTIADFALIDHKQQPFTRDSIRGAWTLWFFGFTHCPDICPITLGTLTASVKQLKASKTIEQPIKIIFVSVDPQRDSADRLNTYLSGYGDDVLGVTAAEAQLAPFLKNMGVIAIKQDNDGQLSDYSVDHSSAVFLVAPDTSISAYFSSPHSVDNIVQDVLTIHSFYP